MAGVVYLHFPRGGKFDECLQNPCGGVHALVIRFFHLFLDIKMDIRELLLFSISGVRFGCELEGEEQFRQKMKKQAHTRLVGELRLLDRFFDFFRMSPETFDRLFSMVGPWLRREPTLVKIRVPELQRLELTLRYLAHGDSYDRLEVLFRVPKSSIGEIIKETSQMLWVILWPNTLELPTKDEWRGMAAKIDEQWQFPHTLGALGGRHVIMQAPLDSASTRNSVVLFAACDTRYRFTLIDVGPYAEANCSPSSIFDRSEFSDALNKQHLDLPPPELFEKMGKVLPFSFATDESFSIRDNLLCPFIGEEAKTLKSKTFNYRISRVWQLIENTFAVMSSNFRVFKQPIVGDVETGEHIAKACACLHNFLKSIDDELPEADMKYCPAGLLDTEGENGMVTEGSWRSSEPCKGLLNLSKSGDHDSYWPGHQKRV